MKSNDIAPESANLWNTIVSAKTDDQHLESEAQLLLMKFLSAIEQERDKRGLSREALAETIGMSIEDLNDVYDGKKHLDFLTIVKAQKSLGIQFSPTIL